MNFNFCLSKLLNSLIITTDKADKYAINDLRSVRQNSVLMKT